MKIKFGRDPIFRRIILIDRWESILNLLDSRKKTNVFCGGVGGDYANFHRSTRKIWKILGVGRGADDIWTTSK